MGYKRSMEQGGGVGQNSCRDGVTKYSGIRRSLGAQVSHFIRLFYCGFSHCRPGSTDPRAAPSLIVTFDLGTVGTNGRQLFNILNRAVNSGQIEQYSVTTQGFAFRELRGKKVVPLHRMLFGGCNQNYISLFRQIVVFIHLHVLFEKWWNIKCRFSTRIRSIPLKKKRPFRPSVVQVIVQRYVYEFDFRPQSINHEHLTYSEIAKDMIVV